MCAYRLNKHFTTNQDFKLLSFERAPGEGRPVSIDHFIC